ncbi:uncharacterized protein LOC119669721 [Teleopsis dalmanni]|uniref:uncharacterized protein LOC119669721 n=1 Tax=Teleopsis dalmanni TaxID=139649 RepID=UPI0018CE2E96|nr:uncharacterized protein LOC119669721 [Teleopsis dalmanni]
MKYLMTLCLVLAVAGVCLARTANVQKLNDEVAGKSGSTDNKSTEDKKPEEKVEAKEEAKPESKPDIKKVELKEDVKSAEVKVLSKTKDAQSGESKVGVITPPAGDE